MNDMGGVWRTIGGRRIFIKDGQDLASAMIESGKFKSKKNEKLGAGAQSKNLVKPHKEMTIEGTVNSLDAETCIQLLKEYENKIVLDNEKENAIMILEDGTICHSYGVIDEVYPYDDLKKSIHKGKKIIYMTHNHPHTETNYSFDSTDRKLWNNNNDLLILRGIDKKYTYQFSRLNDIIDKEEPISIFEIKEEDAQHYYNIGFAKEFKYGYTRNKNNKLSSK